MSENIEKLVEEIHKNRDGNYEILERIKKFRNKLDTLIPESADYRNKRLMEERMKTFTEIIKAELDVRKTIDSSIKSESEMIRKLEEGMKEENEEISSEDIRKIAEHVKNMANIPENIKPFAKVN